jgi:membrane-associated phospholipid phosphatase
MHDSPDLEVGIADHFTAKLAREPSECLRHAAIISLPWAKRNPDQMERRAFKLWSILAGLIGLVLIGFFVDQPIDRWVATHRAGDWEMAAKLCSRFFAWHWLMAAAGAGLVLASVKGRREWLRVLCVMMVAASLAGLTADVLRGLTGRTRPYAQVPQGFYGVRSGSEWLITKHAYNSFPSGHTAAIAGFAVPLLFWRRGFAWLVFPVISLVAAARVYLGAHHFSDVLAGALLGTLIAVAFWRRTGLARRTISESPPRAARA